nr:MAG TPA: Structural protein [Crassvirales sp.]
MVISINQVRQLYVAKALKANTAALTTAGDIVPKADTAKTTLYFQYMSPAGLVSSDKIDIKNVMSAKATSSDALAQKLIRYSVTLDSDVSATPVAGQNYILRLAFRQYIGLSEEDQYFKYGEVIARSGMTAEQFYQAMVASLNANMSKDKLVNVSLDGVKAKAVLADNAGITVTAKTLGTAGNSIKFAIDDVAASAAAVDVTTVSGVTTITASLTADAKTIKDLKALIADDAEASALVEITGTPATTVVVEDPAVALTGGSTTGIIIEEAEQPWVLGMMPQAFIPFTPQFLTITVDGEERLWGVATMVTPTKTVPDGHLMADLEYFCMGARGDIYRGMGYPNIIKTTYLVDPSAVYDVLDIHYFSTGSNESVQKSEKTITLIAVNDGSHTAMNALIGAINTASGLTIATLS